MSSSKSKSTTENTRTTITRTRNEQGVRIGRVSQGLQSSDITGLLSGIQGIVQAGTQGATTAVAAAAAGNNPKPGPGGALGPAQSGGSSRNLVLGAVVLVAVVLIARRR